MFIIPAGPSPCSTASGCPPAGRYSCRHCRSSPRCRTAVNKYTYIIEAKDWKAHIQPLQQQKTPASDASPNLDQHRVTTPVLAEHQLVDIALVVTQLIAKLPQRHHPHRQTAVYSGHSVNLGVHKILWVHRECSVIHGVQFSSACSRTTQPQPTSRAQGLYTVRPETL